MNTLLARETTDSSIGTRRTRYVRLEPERLERAQRFKTARLWARFIGGLVGVVWAWLVARALF